MEICLAIVVDVDMRMTLIGRRPSGVHLAFKWEFPGGKIEEGESPKACAVREAMEETGLAVRIIESWDAIDFDYPDRTVRLQPFLCEADSSRMPSGRWRWVRIDTLPTYDFPEANYALVKKVLTICSETDYR